ncbi:MAG: nucleoside hydrolase [Novipirellula sp. JB048]
MTRKIIIDCDPGIDDTIPLCMAMFDPRLEVLAITATAGTVDADQATSNAIAIVEQLDPQKYPRIGKASVPDDGPAIDDRDLNGSDGLGGCNLPEFPRQHLPLSEKVIAELARKFPNEVTVVCLGPTTNLGHLCRLDPGVLPLLDKIVIGGGAVNHVGNVTAAAEFNMYFDPVSAADVFASATTKSLVPLDLVDAISFGVDLLEKLPTKHSRVGNLLHKLLPFAFRAAHQRLGRELIPLRDATTILSLLEPDLFSWESMAGRVETRGEWTRGMTVFDQRLRPEWPVNMEVALGVDADEAQAMLVRGLRYAGQQS